MIRCNHCIYPITRPDAHFDEGGICSGCRSYEQRRTINWDERMSHLRDIIAASQHKYAAYDCVVPVSGGKDSTFQVIKMLALGAKVLAVAAATDYLTPTGRRNLDNLKRYCDVIEVTPNIEVRKKLVRIGLFRIGDMSYPEHMAIWSIPTRIAVAMGIPLVVWGEQPQREYATPDGVVPATELNSRWVAEFGGMNGLRLDDLVGVDELTADDLGIFRFPSDERMDAAGVRGIWLGDYIEWDGWKNSFVAQQYGWECHPTPVETSLANYENLDNYVTVPRDFLRFLKFGYTRGTDIACNHVRRGRLTRSEALTLEKHTMFFPWTSLGKPIEEVLGYFNITLDEYVGQCRRWLNNDLFLGLDPKKLDPIPRKSNGTGDAHHSSPAQ